MTSKPGHDPGARTVDTVTLPELAWPAGFVIAMAWAVWHMPRMLVSLGLGTEGLARQTANATTIDWLSVIAAIICLGGGLASLKPRPIEVAPRNAFDRLGLFIGRGCMMLVALTVAVMFIEVVMRYLLARPTLWANELSLWLAGFVFALSGVYAMQQRSHIAITLLHDAVPTWLRRVFDIVSTALIVAFAACLTWGAFNEARDKFFRWETFGTAFDPPIPATLKPLIILVVILIAVQAVVNLVADWSRLARAVSSAENELIGTLRTAGEEGGR
jgi:TRAP-type C4-dicarboxylate transport system permease small subunit